MSDLEIRGIYKTELLFSTKPNSTPIMQAVFVGINANGEYIYNITSISSLKRTIAVNRPLSHDDLPTIYENIMCKPSNLTTANPAVSNQTTLNPSRRKEAIDRITHIGD